MNGKFFIGKRVSSFEKFNPEAPVTGVRLLLDDENGFEAGDMDGNVWEMENPYATQAMADNILASLAGKTYTGFTASAASLGPEAELGDGVTVNGLYSMLAYQNVTFGPGHMSEIAAPGDDEPEEEYKYVPAKEREEARKLGKVRSYIAKTASEIQAMVEEEVSGLSSSITVELQSITQRVDGLNGQYTEVKTTLDGLTVTDGSGTTRIKGSSIETGSIAAGAIKAEQVQLSGAITWGDLDSGAQKKVNDAQTAASSAQSTASSASRAANSAKSAIDNWTYGYTFNGSTYIDGRCLYTGTVTASNLRGGTVEIINGGNVTMARMVLGATQYAGVGLEIDSIYGGMRFQSAGNVFLEAWDGYGYGPGSSDPYIMIGSADVSTNMSFVPSNDSLQTLGSAGHKWDTVYASSGQIQTSDANFKHDIEALPDKYLDMFNYLTPKVYRLTGGTSGRLHVGFIAQEVEEVMGLCGIDSTEFGGFVKDKDDEGKYIYMLRYEEFIPIEWGKLQNIEKRLSALEANYGR